MPLVPPTILMSITDELLYKNIDLLADSKLRINGLALGKEGCERERSSILSDLRREQSLVGAKVYFVCLLGGVARVGRNIGRHLKQGR